MEHTARAFQFRNFAIASLNRGKREIILYIYPAKKTGNPFSKSNQRSKLTSEMLSIVGERERTHRSVMLTLWAHAIGFNNSSHEMGSPRHDYFARGQRSNCRRPGNEAIIRKMLTLHA